MDINFKFFSDRQATLTELTTTAKILFSQSSAHPWPGSKAEQTKIRTRIQELLNRLLSDYQTYTTDNDGQTPFDLLRSYVAIGQHNQWNLFASTAEEELFSALQKLPQALTELYAQTADLFVRPLRFDSYEKNMNAFLMLLQVAILVETRVREHSGAVLSGR